MLEFARAAIVARNPSQYHSDTLEQALTSLAKLPELMHPILDELKRRVIETEK